MESSRRDGYDGYFTWEGALLQPELWGIHPKIAISGQKATCCCYVLLLLLLLRGMLLPTGWMLLLLLRAAAAAAAYWMDAAGSDSRLTINRWRILGFL